MMFCSKRGLNQRGAALPPCLCADNRMAQAANSESCARDPAPKAEPAIDDVGMIDELALGLGLSSGAKGGNTREHASRTGGPGKAAPSSEAHGEEDGGDDGDLFDDVFGGGGGTLGEYVASASVQNSGSPRSLGAERVAGLQRCAICKCTSQDPDLASNTKATDRLTPFVSMQPAASAFYM